MVRHNTGKLMHKAAPVVTLYSRPGCHLCQEAKAIIEPLLAEFGATLYEVNIDVDPDLAAQFGNDIPVIFIGAHKAAKHRVNPQHFRRQLQEALNSREPSPSS